MRIFRSAKILLLFLAFFLLPIQNAAENPASGYHDYEALTGAIKQLASQNSQLCKLISIGKTAQGRDLWLLQISGTKGLSPQEKQALLICGNAEGDHVIGSEVALGIAEYLVTNYGKEDKVTQVLDKRTFYIVPRLNPDGAEYFFKQTLEEHPGNLKPRDDDYDWLIDEDGPEDLNGDGKITFMRVKDKEGEWFIDKKDPRLMKKKETDTPLDSLYKIFPEGVDDDGDELYNEDGPGGFNINRNFPHNFGYKQKGLGVYPASEVETTSLIDFMARYDPEFKGQPHRNICGVLLFSKFDNLAAGTGIEGGTPTFPQLPRAEAAAPSGMRVMFMMGRRGDQAAPRARPTDPQPKKTNAQDTHLFEAVSKKYKDITGIKSAVSDKPFGSLLEFVYFQFGVPAFSANLWSLRQEPAAKAPSKPSAKPQRKDMPGASQPDMANRMAMFRQMAGAAPAAASQSTSQNDEKWLEWIDKKNDGRGFVEWTKYNHKQLGEVEIGGFEPYLQINPPAEQIPDLSKKHAEFALYLASQFAEIEMEAPQLKKISSRLFELKIKVHNMGQFPYATGMGLRTRNITPIMLRLKFEDDEQMKLFGGNKRIDLSTLAAGAEKEYKWIIISPPGKKIDVTLWARNGGGLSKKQIVLR